MGDRLQAHNGGIILKKILLMVVVGPLIMFVIISSCVIVNMNNAPGQYTSENQLILIQDIKQAQIDGKGADMVKGQIDELQSELKQNDGHIQKDAIKEIACIYGVCILIYMLVTALILYVKILRPFEKLKDYAGEVAKGNLDVPLGYEKTNFFGEFTWAFDHMRKELLSAKKNEQKAIEQNKTIIATLSHDIKTPIASIRAYAEGLEAGIGDSYEKRQKYLQVIQRKCDEVTALTNDLVLHSLSELDKLEIKETDEDIGEVLERIVCDFASQQIHIKEPFPHAECTGDKKRMAQVIENILNNAGKYAAGKEVCIWADISDGCYNIHIKDHGKGIPAQDMPFVFDKFYRGKNVSDKPGSGLGLYITKYIIERMQGHIELKSYNDGLEVIISLKIS